MVRTSRSTFGGLGRLDEIPRPIPDDEEDDIAQPSRPSLAQEPPPAAPPLADQRGEADAVAPAPAAPTAPAQPAGVPEASQQESGPPGHLSRPSPTPTRRRADPARQPPGAGERRAATSIRLRQSAADPLYDAFLEERRTVDPRLSYPEFASRIVLAGLDTERRRRQRRSES